MKVPYLVKDIRPGSGGSYPFFKVATGDILSFQAFDGVNGSELWKSDGTEAGTVLVKDIFPGSGSSAPGFFQTVVGDVFFFNSRDGVTGYELWKSDGTAAGTVLVKDINPGPSDSYPRELIALGDTLFFTAGEEQFVIGPLWKSDGTEAGTVLVKDTILSASDLTLLGNTLFFAAVDSTNDFELWKSDGTEEGTVLVKNINTGVGSYPYYLSGSFPSSLTAVGNTLFFIAYESNTGLELWKSDGTETGTVLVKNINPATSLGYPDPYPSSLTAVGNTLFFIADDNTTGRALWKSDGTEVGTVLIKDINPNSSGYGPLPLSLTAVGNTLFFTADNGVNGFELWKSDGTEAGTVLVKDINPGSNSSYPGGLTAAGNTLFFIANDGVNGAELWKSDGTEAGTVLVKNINPDAGSYPFELAVVGNTLFFLANDGINGAELWALDLTPGELIFGSPDADILIASSDLVGINDIIFTGAEGDEVDIPIGGTLAGNNRIHTGSGKDTIYVAKGDRANGGSGDDYFDASDATGYRLSGGEGNDSFDLGASGRALGGDGDDQFYVGEEGDNLLSGGAGADQFWLLTDAPELITIPNTVTDFKPGTDVIGIANQGPGVGFANLRFSGNNIAIAFSNNPLDPGITFTTLTGIQTNTLTAANFVFDSL